MLGYELVHPSIRHLKCSVLSSAGSISFGHLCPPGRIPRTFVQPTHQTVVVGVLSWRSFMCRVIDSLALVHIATRKRAEHSPTGHSTVVGRGNQNLNVPSASNDGCRRLAGSVVASLFSSSSSPLSSGGGGICVVLLRDGPADWLLPMWSAML